MTNIDLHELAEETCTSLFCYHCGILFHKSIDVMVSCPQCGLKDTKLFATIDKIEQALQKVREDALREAADVCRAFAEGDGCQWAEQSETAYLLNNKILSLLKEPEKKEK